jgi:hypothetical protein
MGKYLSLWEIDRTRLPVSPKERVTGMIPLLEKVKQELKNGQVKDWGVFVGETSGYSINEGTEVELMKGIQQYSPFVQFKVHAIASVDQVLEVYNEMIKALTK